LRAECCAVEGEGAEVRWCETFDDVFLDSSGRGDDCGDVFVLDEVSDCFAEAGGDEVAGVPEEDCCGCVCFWVTPCSLNEMLDDYDEKMRVEK